MQNHDRLSYLHRHGTLMRESFEQSHICKLLIDVWVLFFTITIHHHNAWKMNQISRKQSTFTKFTVNISSSNSHTFLPWHLPLTVTGITKCNWSLTARAPQMYQRHKHPHPVHWTQYRSLNSHKKNWGTPAKTFGGNKESTTTIKTCPIYQPGASPFHQQVPKLPHPTPSSQRDVETPWHICGQG